MYATFPASTDSHTITTNAANNANEWVILDVACPLIYFVRSSEVIPHVLACNVKRPLAAHLTTTWAQIRDAPCLMAQTQLRHRVVRAAIRSLSPGIQLV